VTNFLKKAFLRAVIYVARFRLELLLLPFVYLSAMFLYAVRSVGVYRLTRCRSLFRKIGIFPIIDRYDEPLFQPDKLNHALNEDRLLPGVDLNDAEQLELLSKFHFNEELTRLPIEKSKDLHFFYHNSEFKSGDAEYFYNMIRYFKPSRLIEVGAGNSTLLALQAINRNKDEDPAYCCEQIAIEPYRMPWLETTGIRVIRDPVEKVESTIFQQLKKNDVLFIDSSHMVRPQGDITHLYLNVLPSLAPGVLVHVHDIFTPKDYPFEWIIDNVRLWNEQYVLEAFLTFNGSFRVLAALNYLKHHYPDQLASKCPILQQEFADREPGSFWLMKSS
jgi:methyltransferase family protein